MRWPWVLLAAGLVGLMSSSKAKAATQGGRASRERMVALVRRVARELGVAPAAALAFAEVESNFNAGAQGDLEWPTKRPDMFRKLVTERDNPYRGDPSLWHSYGLFGLLAAYHVQPGEHPHVLLDPEINARRGIAYLKRLLKTTAGDVAAARLAYIGCGVDGRACSSEVTEAALERFAPVYQRWSETQGAA